MFKCHIDEKALDDIRQSTQKWWALGSERFNDEIEKMTRRRTRPISRGGDRRSRDYRHGKR
jgi:putative transposase